MDDRVITGHIPGIDDQNINNNKVTTNILSQKTIIVSILAVIIIILFIIWPYISAKLNLIKKENDYQKALKEYESKNYQQAQNIFDSLKDYKDCKKMSDKCKFMLEIGIEFCKCRSGEYLMGSPANDNEQYSDEPLHKVYISKDFYIGKYPVTQKQYEIIMGTNPSKFKDNKDSDNLPVENVTWKNANEFCIKMTEKYKIILEEDYIFDLPTEAQWEYACRAGINDSRYGKLDEIAWFHDNANQTTHVIGQKKPNAWGIYDMLGNVFEWCKDRYDNNIPYKKDVVYNDPYIYTNSDNTLKYVNRGGSWNSSSRTVRAAYRGSNYYNYCDDCGFRVAIVKNRKAISSQNN